MKGSIVVLSLLLLVASCIAAGKDGFAFEYQKFDNLIKNFKQPSQTKHIKNLKNAIPLRVVIDFDDLQKYGSKGVPADCFDDDGKAAYCQYDQMGENVVSSYVDVIVKLPYDKYPYEADNVKEDDDSDKRQQLLDAYTSPINASINQAVSKATCEVISNSISSVGYTTKFGFTVGIICPDDKTYRNNLATNPDFYNNVIDSKLGKTLLLKPNLASNIDLKSISNDFDGDLSDVKRKMDQVRVDSELAEEIEKDVEKKQMYPSSTGYNYENSQCGGVWYNDYLDGAVDGNCIGGTCEYIKNGGKGTQFYLLDSGVNFRHQEFKKSYEEGRLLNHIVLNRTEYRRIHHQLVGSAYAGILSPPPINLPDIPKDWRPFQTSPWKGLTRYPISPFTGRPIGRTNVYTRPIASLELALLYDYIEDPINDKISHGTSMAGIVIGDNLGIAKGSTLTSFKVLTATSGVVEYAMKAAFNRIIATQVHNNILRKLKPTVLVTGVNFIYPHDCVTDTTNCAIDIISNIQIVIRLGVVFITPAMNGFINVRDYHFQPPGITVAKPFPSGFDICHWARYVRDVQPGADASYDGFPAYFPQMLLSGDEIFPYTHIRPIRVTGFNPSIKMVPYVGKATDSLGNSALDINGFNYGSCIDYAVPGSEIEKLTVLNKTVYGQMDVVEQLYAFNETDSDYPGGITNWFLSDLPSDWEATGKSFPSGYKNYPFVSSGTSFSSPIAGVTVMSTLIAKWSTIKPTSPAAAGLYMKRVFQSVNELNLLPGVFTQPNAAYTIGYSGLANLNNIWGEPDPEQSSYPLKKSPSFRPIKMNKVNPSCF